MAEALLRHLKGDEYEAYSAGSNPTSVNPHAIRTMEEIGIDMSGHRCESIDVYLSEEFDLVVTVCDSAREACPFFPGGKEHDHRSFRDPPSMVNEGEDSEKAFRKIRDEIGEWIRHDF